MFSSIFIIPPFFLAVKIGIIINAPTKTAKKSKTTIDVVIKKSKIINIAALIPNKIQNIFLLSLWEIIFEIGFKTNTDICIEINASKPIAKLTGMDELLPELANTNDGIKNNGKNKNGIYFFINFLLKFLLNLYNI